MIFHTKKLNDIREFYEKILNLPVGTYTKDNREVPDCSEAYVNYHIGSLLCFEVDGDRTDVGTVVLNVPNFEDLRSRLTTSGIKITGGNEHFFKIKDPDGRSVIIEPT